MTTSRRMPNAPPEVRAANFRRYSKLTPEQARAIRASGEPQKLAAARYGVSVNNVSMIRRGMRWAYA